MNQTAGYHRRFDRLPILLKIPFKRMKMFFFQKLLIILFNLPNLKIFSIFPKNLTIKVEKTF